MDSLHINPEKIFDLVISYLPRLALAIVTLVIGLWLIRIFGKFIGRIMAVRNIDDTLRPYIKTLTKVLLTVLLLVSVMGMIGIEMTSFIALLGAVGIAIGMALAGSLQHFAGGVLLLVYKPFKKGDTIFTQDILGVVKEIGIFSTVVVTFQNQVVSIPNGPLSNGIIINYTADEKRRIDISVSISYSDKISKAKDAVAKVIEGEEIFLKDPPPIIGVGALSDSSVDIDIKVWVKTTDYLTGKFILREKVKNEFDKIGITIPFPQMDVNLKK